MLLIKWFLIQISFQINNNLKVFRKIFHSWLCLKLVLVIVQCLHKTVYQKRLHIRISKTWLLTDLNKKNLRSLTYYLKKNKWRKIHNFWIRLELIILCQRIWLIITVTERMFHLILFSLRPHSLVIMYKMKILNKKLTSLHC